VADFVSIGNLALAKIGEPYRIISQAEDSLAARTIRSVLDLSRRSVLRRGKLNFSITRAELTAQAPTDPDYRTPYPFQNRFPVPSDLVRLVEVIGPREAVESYRFESRAILADTADPVFIRYVRDVVELGDWDDMAVETLAARIGYEIADVISGDRGRKSDCWSEFTRNTKEAGGVDGKEDPPEEPYESSWVTARSAGGIGGPPNI
jgi:hypothetical protein